MKKNKKIIAIMLVAVMLFAAFSGVSKVFAETGTTAGTVTFSADDTDNQLTITRNVKDTAENVTNTFTYTVEQVTDNSNYVSTAVGGTLPTPTVVFTNSEPDSSNVATETGILDLAGVTFTKLGNYAFKVTETNSSNQTKYPLDDKEYYIYVSVRNELDENNQPTGNFIATLADKAKLSDAEDKVDLKYESNVPLQSVEISKTVTGNMADINEYFAFTLTINGLAGTTYTVTGAHSTDGNETVDSSTVNAGANTIYLKHGQTITIGNLPEGTTYTITETGAADYDTKVDGNNGKASGTKKVTSANTNDNTAFVNNKEETNLTGIFINIAPFVGLIILAIIGIVLIKKSSDND